MSRAYQPSHGGNHGRTRSPEGTNQALDPLPWDDLLQTWSTGGTLSANTGVSRWYPPMSGTLDWVHVAVGSSPSGGTVGVRVNFGTAGGTGVNSIGTRTLEPGVYAGTFTPTSTTRFGTADYFTVDIYSAGTAGTAGYLTTQFWGRYR